MGGQGSQTTVVHRAAGAAHVIFSSIYLTPALFCCFLAFLRTAPGARSTTNETRRPPGSTPLASPSERQTAQRKAGGSIRATPAVRQQRRATLVDPCSHSGNVSLIQVATIAIGCSSSFSLFDTSFFDVLLHRTSPNEFTL